MTAPDVNADVRACPFCGKGADVRREDVKFTGAKNGWYVSCNTEECPAYNIAEDGEMGGVLHSWPTRKAAIEAWNRRAAHADMAGEVRELVEVVQALERACDEDLIANTSHEDSVGVLSDAAKAALAKFHPTHQEKPNG